MDWRVRVSFATLLSGLLLILTAPASPVRLRALTTNTAGLLLLGATLSKTNSATGRANHRPRLYFPVIRNFSGADVYFERLADGLRSRGYTPEVRFYPHLMEFLPYTLVKPFLPGRVRGDIVHAKAEYGWLFATSGRRLVVTLAHSVFVTAYLAYKNPAQRLYYQLKLRANIARSFDLADRIVTVSRFSANSIAEEFGRGDARVIYNGIDEKFFHPLADPARQDHGQLLLFFAGNATTRKGFDLLAPLMRRLGAGFVLEYTSGLRTQSKAVPEPNMRPLGRLTPEGLRAAYQRCDIFVFPSRLEGFGYPVAEAMACGKPVVCTNGSSLPELVEESRGGYLCPRDDVEAFAERIQQLASQPQLRAEMGAYNRAKVERQFTLSRCVEDYVGLYEELA